MDANEPAFIGMNRAQVVGAFFDLIWIQVDPHLEKDLSGI
jgi:hypothetical protein